jgi:hypothetical protein
MKQTLLLIFSICAIMGSAQTVQYSIEFLKPDSIFVVERASQLSPESPRPQEIITSRLFRDTSELSAFALQLKTEAENLALDVARMKQRSDFMTQRANAINSMKFRGSWVVPIEKTPEPDTPKPTAPTKPKTKTKKRG